MVSVSTIYTRAISVLKKKPMLLWGISLLEIVLGYVASILFGIIPGVSLGISILLGTAMTMIFLRGYRGEEISTVQLFSLFKDWNTAKRVLAGMGWMYLWIFLWALIPLVGFIFAIIRSYEYRLTPYILVNEPNVPITDAIKISKEKTDGYKSKMFLADILVYLIFVGVTLVLGLLSAIPLIGVLFGLVLFVISVVFSVLSPLFVGLVQAAFYEEITNKPQTAYCPRCGQPVDPTAAFCPHCGQPFRAQPQQQTENAYYN